MAIEFRNALKAEFLGEGGRALWSMFTSGAKSAATQKIAEKAAEIGGTKGFTDEKWLDVTRKMMDDDKRRIWDRVIHPSLLKDFGDGFFSRIGYIDAATKIRLNLEAKAQDEIPTIKMEIKDAKGKVTKVITRPVTSTKPLSTWCLENYVDEFLLMKQEHIDGGKTEAKATQLALKELRVIMRDAGFAVGQAPKLYQKLDDFVGIIPGIVEKSLKFVKTARQHGAGRLKKFVDERRAATANREWYDRIL